MASEDDVWKLYAKSVKKIPKAKTARSAKALAFPSRLREGLGAGGEFATPRKLNHLSSFTSPPSVPPASGRDAVTATLDHRTEKNLRQGEIALQARIDLHGMTQVEAHETLARFLASAVKAGKRNLLIITGKGRGNAGVLKTNLPHWLHALPEAAHVLAIRPAALKHGGDGAFYVLLKKAPGLRFPKSSNL